MFALTDDHSRVVLKHDGTPGSDYINGSFIDVRKIYFYFLFFNDLNFPP